MRLHRSLLALIAVFALTNVGLATFIAAAPAHLATVTIASASDDLPTPPPAPILSSSNVLPVPCRPQLLVTPTTEPPSGIVLPSPEALLGKFDIIFPRDGNCFMPSTPPLQAIVRSLTVRFETIVQSVTVEFGGSGLNDPNASNIALKNITIRNASTNEIVGIGTPLSTTNRISTIRLRAPLLIPYDGRLTLLVRANTQDVLRSSSAQTARIITTVTKLNADIPYQSVVGSTDHAKPQPPQAFISFDAQSPSGTQTSGAMKQVASFLIEAPQSNQEPIIAERIRLEFRAATPRGRRAEVRDVIVRFRDAGETQTQLGPAQLRNGIVTLTRSGTSSATLINPGQTLRVIVLADTTGTQDGATLQVFFSGLWARGDSTGTLFPTNLVRNALTSNILMY